MFSTADSVMWRTGAFAVILLILTVGASASELARTTVWSMTVSGGVGSPTPYPSAEAADGVVVCGGDNQVMRLDGKGQPVFRYDMGDLIGGMAACGDIDGDGNAEIVAATVRGRIVALSGDGQPKWRYETHHPFGDFANVVLARRPDGAGCDVLIHHRDGWLTCLNGKGRHRWSFRIAEPGHISAPAVGDINGDGKLEYVCGIDAERVIALTSEGRLLWEFASPDEFGREPPIIADADRDGKPEVYTLKGGATSAVFCLDGATGKSLWVVPIGSKCYCALTAADINADGHDEILAATKYNQVIAISHKGQVLWQTTMGGSGVFSSPVVGDIDGDGRLEIVVGTRGASADGNSVYVLDTKGNLLGGYPQNRGADSAKVIADINRDGLLEVVASSSDTIYAYQFGKPTKLGAVRWPCYRANAALTGCQLPLRPAQASAPQVAIAPKGTLLPQSLEPILGETEITAAWSVPTPRSGYVEVTLVDPQGMRVTQAFRTAPDRQSVELQLPFGHGGRYGIAARLLDTAEHRGLVEETRQLIYEPLAAERKTVAAALESLTAASSTIPATAPIAGELERRRSSLRAVLGSLEARLGSVAADAPIPQTVLDAAAALRAETGREEGFARFARKVAAAAPNLLVAVWQDTDPWDNADPRDELPTMASDTFVFSAWAYGDQREDFCLNLMGLGPERFKVRVEPADLVGPDGAKAPWEKHLHLLEVVWMPTTLNPTPVPDMLPGMNRGYTIEIAPGSFAQLWIVVDTEDLTPGAWTISLHLQSLAMSAAAADATLHLDVLPVALPYPYPWKMCNWAWPTSFPEPLRDRIIENLISHGSNVMYAPTPSRACDAQGRLLGEVDWAPLDSLVAKAKPGDPFLFFGPLPLNGPAGMTQDSPIWKNAYKQWMNEFVAHLASIGIDYRHFAFYPVDEPGNSGHTSIEQLIAAAKILREADPRAPIYADPAGGAYTAEWIRELDPWVDVWAPASGLSSRADIHEIISTRNRRVWMYDAPGNVRMLSPLGFYRRQPWSALRDGARGSGFWVYYSTNLWAVGATHEPDYGTVAIDRTDVVDSRRWRAAHDGVQDVTAVLLLDEAIADAEKLGIEPELCTRAKATRAETVAAVTAGEDAEVLPFEVLQRSRRQIANALLALRRAIAAKKP